MEQEVQAAAEPELDQAEIIENAETQVPPVPLEVVPEPVREQLAQAEPVEQAPIAPGEDLVTPVQSEAVITSSEQPIIIEQQAVEPMSVATNMEVAEVPLDVAAPPEPEEPEVMATLEQPIAVFAPEPLVPQPEAVPIEEVPYEPTEEPEAIQAMSEEIHTESAPQESAEPITPTAQSEAALVIDPPAVTDSIEQFEVFVTELHDIETPPEKLEIVHEKVDKITELTVMIREAKLLDAGEGVAEITEELVETFIELFEATGMKPSEEHVRHMVQLWIARDVLAGKDFETAKAELLEDKGMREVLQQFMHGIAKLKELLESLHIRLGKLVLASSVQSSQAV